MCNRGVPETSAGRRKGESQGITGPIGTPWSRWARCSRQGKSDKAVAGLAKAEEFPDATGKIRKLPIRQCVRNGRQSADAPGNAAGRAPTCGSAAGRRRGSGRKSAPGSPLTEAPRDPPPAGGGRWSCEHNGRCETARSVAAFVAEPSLRRTLAAGRPYRKRWGHCRWRSIPVSASGPEIRLRSSELIPESRSRATAPPYRDSLPVWSKQQHESATSPRKRAG